MDDILQVIYRFVMAETAGGKYKEFILGTLYAILKNIMLFYFSYILS